MGTRRRIIGLLVVAVAGAGASNADAAKLKSCGKVVNPYPNTRYAGVDLTKVTARGVSCATAKRVAKRAHLKALGLPVPVDGIRHFSWDRWKVTGDLRPASDRYVATRGSLRVTWRF